MRPDCSACVVLPPGLLPLFDLRPDHPLADRHRHAVHRRPRGPGEDVDCLERMLPVVPVDLRHLHAGDHPDDVHRRRRGLEREPIGGRVVALDEEIGRERAGVGRPPGRRGERQGERKYEQRDEQESRHGSLPGSHPEPLVAASKERTGRRHFLAGEVGRGFRPSWSRKRGTEAQRELEERHRGTEKAGRRNGRAMAALSFRRGGEVPSPVPAPALPARVARRGAASHAVGRRSPARGVFPRGGWSVPQAVGGADRWKGAPAPGASVSLCLSSYFVGRYFGRNSTATPRPLILPSGAGRISEMGFHVR